MSDPNREKLFNPTIHMGYKTINDDMIDALVNQYLLCFGDFSHIFFRNKATENMLWLLFLASLFISQLTFMNMIIAIMGDSFARVTENRRQYAMMEHV